MSWLEDIQNHRKRQVSQMAKAFGCDETDLQKAEDDGVDYTVDDPEEEETPKTSKKKNTGKSNMYKMKMLGLRKFNDQDQKTYIGVEDAENSYITNLENGDIVISKTDEGYLVSKFPIDENEEGEEKETTDLSEAVDVALQFKEDLDNDEGDPEQIMYKETEKSLKDEINPFDMVAWEASLSKAELDEFEKAKHQDGDMHPNGKWVWRSSANGGKGDWRVASKGSEGAKATAASSDDKKLKLNDKIINSQSASAAKAYVKFLNGKDDKMSFNDHFAEAVERADGDTTKVFKVFKEHLKKHLANAGVAPESVDGYYKQFKSDLDTEAIKQHLKKKGVTLKTSSKSTASFTSTKKEDNSDKKSDLKKEPKAKKAEKPSYESKSASDYDKGDGKVGNYPVPTHTSYSAANLYNRLNNNRHFGFKYGLPSEEIMKKLKDYKGNVKVSEHNNAGTIEIYRIKFT